MACHAPKSVTVKGYWRAKPRRKPKPRAAAYTVTRAGRVVSRHTTLTGAINARKRLDRASFRRGEGRPYNVEKAS